MTRTTNRDDRTAFDNIGEALDEVLALIENTYAHDEKGERTLEAGGVSGADVIDDLVCLEGTIETAAKAYLLTRIAHENLSEALIQLVRAVQEEREDDLEFSSRQGLSQAVETALEQAMRIVLAYGKIPSLLCGTETEYADLFRDRLASRGDAKSEEDG